MNYADADIKAQSYIQRIREDDRVLAVDVVGSLRRGVPRPGDVDLLLTVKDVDAYLAKLGELKGMREPDCDPEIEHADCFFCNEVTYGAVLAFSTGPRFLNRKLERIAAALGLELNNRGLFLAGDPTSPVPTPTEKSFFERLGVKYVTPDEREVLAIDLEAPRPPFRIDAIFSE